MTQFHFIEFFKSGNDSRSRIFMNVIEAQENLKLFISSLDHFSSHLSGVHSIKFFVQNIK